MNKNKLLLRMGLNSIAITTIVSLISCSNTQTSKKELSLQFNKDKIESVTENLKEKQEPSPSLNLAQSDVFENEISHEIEENENFEVDDLTQEDEQRKAIEEEIEITKQQIKDLEQKFRQENNKITDLQGAIIGAGVSSTLITGLSAGIGAYFGHKHSDAYGQERIKQLEDLLKLHKSLLKEGDPVDPLVRIFLKLMHIGFKKDLPGGIFDLFDELLFKKALANYITQKEKDEFKEKLKNDIKEKSIEIVEDLLESLRLKNIVKENDSDKVINSVKSVISKLMKKYLPDFINSLLNFISKITTADNKQESREKEGSDISADKKQDGTSLLGRAIYEAIKIAGYNPGDAKNVSEIIKIFVGGLTDSNNKLIKIIINNIASAIDDVNLTFNLSSDLIEIVKKTISNLITKPNSNELDINSIFNKLVPAFLGVLENVAMKSENGEQFVTFVNNLFEFTSISDSNKNEEKPKDNKKPLYYSLIGEAQEQGSSRSKRSIEANSLQGDNKQETISILPNIDITFSSIVAGLFKIPTAAKVLSKFLTTFIKPLIKVVKDKSQKQATSTSQDTQSNSTSNDNNAYKAIFRIYSLYSYLYYKNIPQQNGFLGDLISFVNPFEPEKYITKLIKKEWSDISEEQLKKIFGEYKKKEHWYDIKPGTYNIFNELKQAAKENNNTNKFHEIIKKGTSESSTNQSNSQVQTG